MKQKGFVNIILVILVIVLAVALVYVTVDKKKVVEEKKEVQTTIPAQTTKPVVTPALSQAAALTLVKETWGGCTQDTCSEVTVTVNKVDATTYVTATYEGLRDDSTSAQRKTAVAQYANGTWTLDTPTTTHSCQPGRGHQDFSKENCI